MVTALLVFLVAPEGAAGQTRGGGIDGGLPGTTNGADPVAPSTDAVPATTPATTATTITTATTATVPTTAPAATAPAPGPGAQTVAQSAGTDTTRSITTDATAGTLPPRAEEVAVAGGDEGFGDLRPASAIPSSGRVWSPGLLVAGVALALGGAVALARRSRRPAGGPYS